MGANLYSERPGAVLELDLPEDRASNQLEAWQVAIARLLERLGWTHESIVVRHRPGSRFASCFLSAPIDGLLAATEINEQAWLAAERELAADTPDYTDVVSRLRVFVQHDRRPALAAMVAAAHARGLSVTIDDDSLTVGAGTGSWTAPVARLPEPANVPWKSLHDVPLVLVTGSNGKTTTTRLLARMLCAAGHTVGWSCTDGVSVGNQIVADGDYAGPAGARRVLRDPRVTAAVLETARGGILRRGLAVERAQAAVVTNVADDHLGEYGIEDLRALGETKLVVAKAIPRTGRVILNADDATLSALADTVIAPVTWFSLEGETDTISRSVAAGADACVLHGHHLIAWHDGTRHELARAADVPISLGGTMRFNLANALAASAAALALRVPIDRISHTLRTFGTDAFDNPGRSATLTLRGARLLVDFVHNPDGWNAIAPGLAGIAGRRLVVIGQAGDRDNRAIHALAIAAWRFAPDVLILKEMPAYLRGRAPGETTDLLAAEFIRLGASPNQLVRADDELAAIDHVTRIARPGDLVVLAVHDDFPAAMQRLQAAGAVVGPWP
ncbi:MAG: UDP-N-acetylmuramoyl-L-alanyl-D-glutamate--2,6-diaminopimelate ligase [Gemmatimonadaceae bacterium]|nr:UDP-N-acetylmuramoyl-L-alanyl-D-glutamate--2,6-diaminopimelate ligase [Gemmatimonadaceae bacterium]